MNTQDEFHNLILSEQEKEAVEKFSSDKFLFEAVKKYVLAVLYKHGTMNPGEPFIGTRNFALNLAWGATQQNGMPRSDEELGQNLRALTYATQLVESGFKELSEFKKVDLGEDDKKNEAE